MLYPSAPFIGAVKFEDIPCTFEIDDHTVDDHFVVSGVVRDVVDIFNLVSVGSKRIDDKIDVYHIQLRGGLGASRLFGAGNLPSFKEAAP